MARWLFWTLLPAAGACLLSAFVPVLDARLNDFVFMLRGPRRVTAPVVTVTTFEAQGTDQVPWGYSAQGLATLVRRVNLGCPAAIVLAITPLTRMPEDEPGLRDLATAIHEAGNVVLPACLVPEAQGPVSTSKAIARFTINTKPLLQPLTLRKAVFTAPPHMLVEAAAGLGTTNLYPDADGVVRSFPLIVSDGMSGLPALPLEAVRVVRKLPPRSAQLERQAVYLGDLRIPVQTDSAEMLLDIPGGSNARLALTAASLRDASRAQLRHAFNGTVVVLSTSVVGTSTLFSTPAGPAATGADLIAACIENLLTQGWLRSVPWYVSWILAFVASGLAAFFAGRLSPLAAILANAMLVVAAFMALAIALSYQLQLSGLCLILSVVFSGVLNATAIAVVAERDKTAAEAVFQSRLRALDQVGELIGSALNRDELLHGIMRWVANELGVEACSLALLDERHRELHFEVALGPKGNEVSDFTVPLGHGIIGVVAQTGEPLIVNEGWRDPRHASEISSAIDFRPRNILCVPMRLHGRVVGVIEAMNKADGEDFDVQDSYLLTTIAAQSALLLENSRLIAELQQRVDYANAELRAAYAQLESEKAKVETLIDQTASPVVAADAENQVVLLNDAAEEALGVRSEDALQKSVFVVLPPELASLFAADLESTGGRLDKELELTGLGDRLTVYHASLALVRSVDGQVLGRSLILNDITELRELDRMKTDLVSFVAHELKNPLSVIDGFTQLCRRRLGCGDATEAANLLERIEKQARRTERLVQDFLNLSRLEVGRTLEYEFTAIEDLVALIEEVIELEPRRRECHTFSIQIPPDLPVVYADRSKLEEVLTNLVSNAVKYSPRGGEIRVVAEVEGDCVQVSVSDQGVGIAPEDQRNLFQKFRRTRGKQRHNIPGTGIGLYLCRHLVEGYGGHIWIESELGVGTTVSFTLPTRPPDAQEGGK